VCSFHILDKSYTYLNLFENLIALSPISKTVFFSKASKSSRYLAKIFLDIFLNKNVVYKDLENYENLEKKTVLLIGDNAIRFSNRFKYVYDLSKIWKEHTGYLFVFAVWAVNKDFFLLNKETIYELNEILKTSKNEFFANLDYFIKKVDFEDKQFLKKYFSSLNYDFSQEHIKSLKKFDYYIKKLRGV
jgi:chorismate dehydratase